MRFTEVTAKWDQAAVSRIHPLRSIDEIAYWESGVYQAQDAAKWIPEGGTVIDFGCGDGRLTLPLARMGFTVTAVDSSPAMLGRLRARTENLDIETIQSDGMDLHGFIDPVDVIVARAVLIHHSHADVAALVIALASCLKKGGYLIADWPVGAHHERVDWIDVTTWLSANRLVAGHAAGLELVEDDTPTVWKKM